MKVCSKCLIELDSSNSYVTSRTSYCKPCNKKVSKERYRKKTLGYKVRDYNKKQLMTAIVRGFKDTECLDCGIKYPPEVMDFDHVRGSKVMNVGSRRFTSIDSLICEILKCEIVCANCHRMRTHSRRAVASSNGQGTALI